MTDPLTPERLAEIRERDAPYDEIRDAIGPNSAEHHRGELLGEIDRLTGRHRLEHERAETLETENAKLAGERDELARILREAIAESGLSFDELQAADADNPTAPVVAAARRTRDRLTAWLDSALDATLPQGAPQPGASAPVAASAQSEPPERASVAQRPTEGFQWEPGAWHSHAEAVQILRRPAAERLTYLIERRDDAIARGIPAELIDEFIADAARAVEAAEPVDLSGELDDFGPEQIAELKRISGLAPEDEGVSSADAAVQAAEDRYMDATVDCPSCDAYGRTRDEHGLTAQPCPRCKGTGRVPGQLTPEQWEAHYGLEVLDPDGWRGANDPPWEQPLTLRDFWRRFARSTARGVPQETYDQIMADLRATASDESGPQ